MNGVMKIALRLIIITVVAGLLLGLTYSVTKDPIAAQEEKNKTEARQTVMPDAQDFEQIDLSTAGLGEEYAEVQEAYYAVKSGEKIGATVTVSTKGYSSGLQVTVGVNADGTVSGVNIDSHDETPGLGAKGDDPVYLSQYAGRTAPLEVVKVSGGSDSEIQALTGATLTSKGICRAVNLACSLYADVLSEGV